MRKLLLIQPSPYDRNRRPIKKRRLYFVGLAMPALAALTPSDWEVEICLETIEEVPFETDADVIGIGSMGHGIWRSIDLAREFKARGKIVVLGGYMASLMPQEALKYCDCVVVGDAEPVWADLLSDYCSGTLKPIYQRTLGDFDPPLPRYELVTGKRIGDALPVQAGRGCPNGCSFCSISCLYRGRYYRRPIKDVIRDIRRVKQLGFRKFLLLDDNILSDRDYMLALCNEIAKLKMTWISQCSIDIGRDAELLEGVAASGCTALSFGLESISSESLLAMNKGWANPAEYKQLIARVINAGIDVSSEMVIGADGDTLESIRDTARFIQTSGIVLPRFYILTPIPGTDFFHEMQAAGRICNDDIYSYNGVEAVHVPKHMSPQQLTDAYWKLYRDLFSVPSILRRTVLSRQVWRHPLRYAFYALISFYYRRQIKQGTAPNIF